MPKKARRPTSIFATFPEDVLFTIFQYLDFVALLRLEQTCAQVKNLMQALNVWRLVLFHRIAQPQDLRLWWINVNSKCWWRSGQPCHKCEERQPHAPPPLVPATPVAAVGDVVLVTDVSLMTPGLGHLSAKLALVLVRAKHSDRMEVLSMRLDAAKRKHAAHKSKAVMRDETDLKSRPPSKRLAILSKNVRVLSTKILRHNLRRLSFSNLFVRIFDDDDAAALPFELLRFARDQLRATAFLLSDANKPLQAILDELEMLRLSYLAARKRLQAVPVRSASAKVRSCRKFALRMWALAAVGGVHDERPPLYDLAGLSHIQREFNFIV